MRSENEAILLHRRSSLCADAARIDSLEECPAEAPDSSPKDVEKLKREVGEAIIRRDLAVLDRLIADDFVVTNPLGQILTRHEDLAALTDPDYDLESLVNDEIKVRVFGDVALATALGTAKGRYKGQDASSQFRYLRVWVKRQGRWQAVATQSTNVPKQGASTN